MAVLQQGMRRLRSDVYCEPEACSFWLRSLSAVEA
jgi:hypothetical protein